MQNGTKTYPRLLKVMLARPIGPGANNFQHSYQINALHWRHNDHDGVSNHQPHGCLLNRLFRRRSKKTSKFRITGLCVGNSPRTKGQLRGKCFHLMTSSWHSLFERYLLLNNVYLNYNKQKLTTTIQQWVGTWLSCIHVRLMWIISLNSSWFMVAYISYMRHETQRFHLCVTNPTFFYYSPTGPQGPHLLTWLSFNPSMDE